MLQNNGKTISRFAQEKLIGICGETNQLPGFCHRQWATDFIRVATFVLAQNGLTKNASFSVTEDLFWLGILLYAVCKVISLLKETKQKGHIHLCHGITM